MSKIPLLRSCIQAVDDRLLNLCLGLPGSPLARNLPIRHTVPFRSTDSVNIENHPSLRKSNRDGVITLTRYQTHARHIPLGETVHDRSPPTLRGSDIRPLLLLVGFALLLVPLLLLLQQLFKNGVVILFPDPRRLQQVAAILLDLRIDAVPDGFHLRSPPHTQELLDLGLAVHEDLSSLLEQLLRRLRPRRASSLGIEARPHGLQQPVRKESPELMHLQLSITSPRESECRQTRESTYHGLQFLELRQRRDQLHFGLGDLGTGNTTVIHDHGEVLLTLDLRLGGRPDGARRVIDQIDRIAHGADSRRGSGTWNIMTGSRIRFHIFRFRGIGALRWGRGRRDLHSGHDDCYCGKLSGAGLGGIGHIFFDGVPSV